MINLKIKYCIIAFVLFISWAHVASASIIINEFVAHPEQGDKEWIELLNTTGSPVDLVGWKFTELSSPSTTPTENDLLSLSGIITNTLVFEVGTSKLNDGGDSIGLYNGSVLIDRVTYGTESTVKDYSINLASSLIGKASAFISGNWRINKEPTKDLPNSNIIEEVNINEDDNLEEIVSTNSNKNKNVEILKITTKIISPKTVTEGIPFSINSLTTTNTGETYAVGKYIWNFGDGMTSETSKSIPFDYIYKYAGEYAVTLSFYNSALSKVVDATSKVIIKVIPSEIYISSVGSDTDSFVEIENKSNYEIVLSDWVITGGIHYFIIPSGTTILPNKKIKLSPKITGFTGEDIKSITITNPNKDIVATYPIEKIYKLTSKSTPTYAIAQKSVLSVDKNSQIINLNDLGGSVEKSGVNISKATYAWIGLFVIIGLGVASFWIIKKRGKYEDYIEKEVRAEDMTIVE